MKVKALEDLFKLILLNKSDYQLFVSLENASLIHSFSTEKPIESFKVKLFTKFYEVSYSSLSRIHQPNEDYATFINFVSENDITVLSDYDFVFKN